MDSTKSTYVENWESTKDGEDTPSFLGSISSGISKHKACDGRTAYDGRTVFSFGAGRMGGGGWFVDRYFLKMFFSLEVL